MNRIFATSKKSENVVAKSVKKEVGIGNEKGREGIIVSTHKIKQKTSPGALQNRNPLQIIDKNVKVSETKDEKNKKTKELPPRSNISYNLRRKIAQDKLQQSKGRESTGATRPKEKQINTSFEETKTVKTKSVKSLVKNEEKHSPSGRSYALERSKTFVVKGELPDPKSVVKEKSSIKNIDETKTKTRKTLLLVNDYVNDIYCYLFSLEDKYPLKANYLVNHKEITARMRSVLLDWIAEIQIQSRYTLETFQMAVSLIDQYLQVAIETKKSQLQLIGIVALFVSIKYEELFAPNLTELAYITDNAFTEQQIRLMEIKFLSTLDFNMSRPIPIHFLRRFCKACVPKENQYLMAKYFCDLAITNYELFPHKSSEIAAASLFLSLNLLCSSSHKETGLKFRLWTPTLEYYSHYSGHQLQPLVKKIAALARDAKNSNHPAIYKKYSDSNFQSISLSPELNGPLIESIIHQCI